MGEYDSRQFGVGQLTNALHDECLRSFAMLLSAHFQGFCRDLYSELASAVAAAVPPHLAYVVLNQCGASLRLNSGNADFRTINQDFMRFGLNLERDLEPDEPTKRLNKQRRVAIYRLNRWRNYCAHYNDDKPTDAGDFDLPAVRVWKQACDEFADELDRIVTSFIQASNLVPI